MLENTDSSIEMENLSLYNPHEGLYERLFSQTAYISFLDSVKLQLRLIYESIGPIIQLIAPTLGYSLGFYYLKSLKDPVISAALGLFISLMNFTCISLKTALGEKLGVETSEAVGAQNYLKVNKSLVYNLCCTLVIFIFLMLLPNIFIEQLLGLIISDERLIFITSEMMHYSIPLIIVLCLSENIKSYCYSHQIESVFGYISLLTVILSVPTMYYLTITLNLWIYGFLICTTLSESTNLILYIAVALWWLPEESKDFCSGVRDFQIRELITYFQSSIHYIVTLYVEFIILELLVIFVSVKLGVEDLAALTITNNIINFIYFVGFGLSNVIRTRLNNLLGEKRSIAAQNFSTWMIISTFILCLIFQIIFFTTRDYFMGIFTENELIFSKMSPGMTIYSFFIYIDIISQLVQVNMRSIGYVEYSSKLNLFYVIPHTLVLNYLFLFVFNLGIWSVMITFVSGLHVLVVLNLFKMRNKKWVLRKSSL